MQKFTKGSLGKIGGESERTSNGHRNEDIDKERTPFNYYYKKSNEGFTFTWKSIVNELNATFKETKKSTAFEGIIITSDKEFFQRLGYVAGEDPPPEVMRFFNRAYNFILREIGYHGTDQNIISAVIHFDETTPHLQLYYLPIVDKGKKKVYAKGADGKVLRNKKGSPIQAKDKHGKAIYELSELEQPKICSSDFWEQRGGQLSFGNLQDAFYDEVSILYGLERGEVGSNKKHTTKYEWQKQQQEAELAKIEERATIREDQASFATAMRDKAMNEFNEINERKEIASEELKPLQEYLDAFKEALKGDLPLSPTKLRKMIVGLTTEYKRLESEKKITDGDRKNLFEELQKAEKRIPELEKYKDFVSLLVEYAPDKLEEAKRAANERKNAPKPPIKTKTSGNYKF
ncbi:MAG: hypothetical protein HDP28_00195 [Clostridia bacterium]|nr:hypothetical protein [Clostridia bacterium]